MIFATDYETLLHNIGNQYCINYLRLIPNLGQWAEKEGITLNEPHQLMKLISSDDTLTMVIQSEIPDEMLDNNIRNLSVRWSMVDNMIDMSGRLGSLKKRLAFSFLKEYARSLEDLKNDELLEDEWAMKAMDHLGMFNE